MKVPGAQHKLQLRENRRASDLILRNEGQAADAGSQVARPPGLTTQESEICSLRRKADPGSTHRKGTSAQVVVGCTDWKDIADVCVHFY